jgi:hypothetical protein
MKQALNGLSKTSIVIITLSLLFRWQLLQVIAWIWMLISYSLKFNPATAWEMTFSGDFPCPICGLVSSGSTTEATFWNTVSENPTLLILPIAIVASFLLHQVLKRFSQKVSY